MAEEETVSVLPRVPESRGMLTMEDGRGARGVSEGASLSECASAGGQERRARFKLGLWGGMMSRRATAPPRDPIWRGGVPGAMPPGEEVPRAVLHLGRAPLCSAVHQEIGGYGGCTQRFATRQEHTPCLAAQEECARGFVARGECTQCLLPTGRESRAWCLWGVRPAFGGPWGVPAVLGAPGGGVHPVLGGLWGVRPAPGCPWGVRPAPGGP